MMGVSGDMRDSISARLSQAPPLFLGTQPYSSSALSMFGAFLYRSSRHFLSASGLQVWPVT